MDGILTRNWGSDSPEWEFLICPEIHRLCDVPVGNLGIAVDDDGFADLGKRRSRVLDAPSWYLQKLSLPHHITRCYTHQRWRAISRAQHTDKLMEVDWNAQYEISRP